MTIDLGEGFFLRPATSLDDEALKRVCLLTGDAGRDASTKEDDPNLLGLIYAVPYRMFEPDLAFAVEESGVVYGYVLGALNTAIFNARLAADWYPKVQAEVADPGPDETTWRGSDWARRLIHHPVLSVPEALADYPSHGHIDLLPKARGRGIGRKVMAILGERLRDAGSRGLFFQVDPRNRGARRFYAAVGLNELQGESLPRHSVYLVRRI